MPCIQTTAIIKNKISSEAAITSGLTVTSSIITSSINTNAVIKSNSITTSASTQSGIISTALIINSGVNNEACPLILCIDGGAASTTLYPIVNGLLNGGTA
jgi:hypothetical protein